MTRLVFRCREAFRGSVGSGILGEGGAACESDRRHLSYPKSSWVVTREGNYLAWVLVRGEVGYLQRLYM